MNVLIDTNVFIDREEQAATSEEVCKTLRILSDSEAQVKLHPDTIKELEKHDSADKREDAIARAKAYGRLESPPRPDEGFLDSYGIQDENERIDNNLIYAVKENAAAFLVTQDSGVIHKAEQLGLEEKILSLRKVREIFADPDKRVEMAPPAIEEDYMYNLDINDSFFDSLKEDYPSTFENWFNEKQEEGRKCWVYRKEEGDVGALLIYKFEEASESDLETEDRVFKICTFKVSLDCTGNKIGELLLKLAFKKALKGGRETVYVTCFPNKENLIRLLENIGFYECGEKTHEDGREKIFRKELVASEDSGPAEVYENYYPSVYDGEEVSKFIVPIEPAYHDRLFTDYPGRQAKLQEFKGGFLAEGNTIKKAYLCHSPTEKVSAGDILLFYRSQDLRSLTSVGVVEEVGRHDNADEVLEKIGRRSVYTDNEIQKSIEEHDNEMLVILFTHNFNLDEPFKKEELEDINVFERPPQSIMEIEYEDYLKIKEEGEFDGRLTIN